MEWTKQGIVERYKEIVESEEERESDRTSALKELLRYDKEYAIPKLKELGEKNVVFALKILFNTAERKDETDKLKPIEEA